MKACARLVLLCAACACAVAQYDEDRAPRYIASEPKPTPVPILKQINRHNEDGSYTYGYEAADGSFKIETKSQAGEVKGKYGYKDDTGKLRVVEYGANRYGFQPAGEGITVAPPTLVDETSNRPDGDGAQKPQGARSQYRAPQQTRQQQSQDYDYEDSAPAPAPAPPYRPPAPARPAPYRAPTPAYRAPVQAAPKPPKPAFFSGAAPAPLQDEGLFKPSPQQQYRPAPSQPQFRESQHFQPQQQQYNPKPQLEYTQAIEYSPNAVPSQPRFTVGQGNGGYQKSQKPVSSQSFSMLDQLLKEFALPNNGAAPLHDITFGSY